MTKASHTWNIPYDVQKILRRPSNVKISFCSKVLPNKMSFHPQTWATIKKLQTCEILKNIKNMIISVLFRTLCQVCFKIHSKDRCSHVKEKKMIFQGHSAEKTKCGSDLVLKKGKDLWKKFLVNRLARRSKFWTEWKFWHWLTSTTKGLWICTKKQLKRYILSCSNKLGLLYQTL